MADIGRERTILLSTHIVADLGAACKEIALLDDGQIVFQGPPPLLLAKAEGRVFEITTTSTDAEVIESRHEVVSRSVANGKVTLRCVSEDGQLPPSATAVAQPTLEESYMAFMAGRGRTSAARQDDEHSPGPETPTPEEGQQPS